jgi:hypothetical protein
MYGGLAYRALFQLPAVTADFAGGPIDWCVPWGSVRRWTGKALNPFGLQALGTLFGFLDTAPLVTMARKGVDFGASGLRPGLRPVGSDRGSDEQWARFGEVMLPAMVAAGQARRVWDPGEAARVIVHPLAIEDKAKPPPGQPQKSRMIHNLAGCLWDSATGERFPSFNDSTPWHDLPSVPLAKVTDLVAALCLLASLGHRSSIHGGTIDLQAAY